MRLASTMAGSFYLSCLELGKLHRSSEFERVGQPPLFIVVKGEDYYEVEVILRHKGKVLQHLYLVM